MTTHTDLIARLREMAGRLRLEAADALEALEQQRDELAKALNSALELVTTDRCDGDSAFASGVNAACERHALGIKNITKGLKNDIRYFADYGGCDGGICSCTLDGAIADVWKCGPANCNQCGRAWIGVWPLGADALECPSCHGNDTDRDSVNNTRSTYEHLSLTELDKEEWFDVCKSIRAGLELDEFDLMWDEFVRLKHMKGVQ